MQPTLAPHAVWAQAANQCTPANTLPIINSPADSGWLNDDAAGITHTPTLNGNQTSTRYGIHFAIGRAPKELWIDPDQSTLLYQAVRELFTNVVKHSKATEATVTIDGDNDEGLTLTVIDNGVGCRDEGEHIKTSPSGFGLFNMRERLRSLGGQFNLESGPAGGCVVRLTVPTPTPTATGRE